PRREYRKHSARQKCALFAEDSQSESLCVNCRSEKKPCRSHCRENFQTLDTRFDCRHGPPGRRQASLAGDSKKQSRSFANAVFSSWFYLNSKSVTEMPLFTEKEVRAYSVNFCCLTV